MIRIKAKYSILLLIILASALLASDATAMNRILNIRHWVAPDHTRIVIDTSDTPDIDIDKNDERIRVDFKDTVIPDNLSQKIILNKPGVTVVSADRLSEGMVRIEITLADHVDAAVFKLKRFEEKPDRVVVDIELPEIEEQEAMEREQVKTERKDRIIVIDPGHGGDDPGAIGFAGTQEKDVVLKIGRKLRDNLNRREGYKAFLTRNGDYYVPFSKRLKIAREYGADLFLSIHADAARNRRAHGLSVYCLSTGGAVTEAARLLARKENVADMMGGSPNGENNDESDPIVLNMYQTNTINTSKTYGITMLKNMRTVIPLKYNSVQGAPFRVLKLPEIPSLLVETAYISNKKEEKLLVSNTHQERIAAVLTKAIVDIIPVEPIKKPGPAVYLTQTETSLPRTEPPQGRSETKRNAAATVVLKPEFKTVTIQYHKVKRGESLEKIAKKYNTTIAALMKLNKIGLHDSLYIDRKIKIAVPDGDTPDKPSSAKVAKSTIVLKPMIETPRQKEDSAPSVYKVKKGDTLEKIAEKYQTSLQKLLKINRMKPKDPLYAGRTVRLREKEQDKDSTAVAGTQKSKKNRKEKVATYRVKKGETLDIIARRNGTTIAYLRQLNRLKPSDPLLANQKLKVPQQSSL